MPRFIKNLEPGSIYITIGFQRSLDGHLVLPRHDRNHITGREIDIATYDAHCAQNGAREEFSWGLYFHRGDRDGIWYNLIRSQDLMLPEAWPTLFRLDRQHVTASPRLETRVVGLVRVLRVPRVLCSELTDYLDWLALESYNTATRTFIWATSISSRSWLHFLPMTNDAALVAGAEFNLDYFLHEALIFAYDNTDYAIGGQLPRPILKSVCGSDLVVPIELSIQKAKNQSQLPIELQLPLHLPLSIKLSIQEAKYQSQVPIELSIQEAKSRSQVPIELSNQRAKSRSQVPIELSTQKTKSRSQVPTELQVPIEPSKQKTKSRRQKRVRFDLS